MKKLFKVVLVLSMVTIILTGCEFNKEEEKGASAGSEEKYSDKILTDQEAIAIGNGLYLQARNLKRFYNGGGDYDDSIMSMELSDAWVANSYGGHDCPANNEKECYQILAGYDEYADKFLTKEVKEQMINDDENLSRTDDGKVKYTKLLVRPGNIVAIARIGLEVKSKTSTEIEFVEINYECSDYETYTRTGNCPKESVKESSRTKYVIVKENDLWKIKEATITFK